MERIRLQGRAPTLGDQHRANFQRRQAYALVDFDTLRDDLNSRRLVGPQLPVKLMPEFSHDAELTRYWRLAQEFKHYGYCEFKSRGTPSLAAHMGF